MTLTNEQVAKELAQFLRPCWIHFSAHALSKALRLPAGRVRRVLESDMRFKYRIDQHGGRSIKRWQLVNWRDA